MEERIKDHLVERSDDRVHRFVLMCTVCGKTWTGPALERSAMNKATARLQTAEEARKYHRMCSFCINPVCNDCFEDVGPIRLCARCAARLKEKLEQLS